MLMTMCWNQRPSNRPSFQQIVKHLDISKEQIILFEQEQEYVRLTRLWSMDISEHLSKLPTIDISSILQLTNEELIEKRQEELQNIADIRLLYEKRLEQVNTVYIQLKSLMMQLEQREQIIEEKECQLNIKEKKRASNPLSQARKKSIEIIKAATSNLNDPMHLLSQKKRYANKPVNNQALSGGKNVQRRKKGSTGHRRNNSKGSGTSWTPPTLTAIEDQEKRRASIQIIPNNNEENNSNQRLANTSIQESRLPTISAEIDHREVNRNDLKLDLNNPLNEQQSPSVGQLSSSELEISNDNLPHTFPRQRRRRNVNSTKIHSPLSSNSSRPIKSHSTHTDEIDHRHYSPKSDLHKHSRNVTFQLSPSMNHSQDQNLPRKMSKRVSYTSSEEGEAEELAHNHDVFNDEIYRAKHAQSSGNFSSESEIYTEQPAHSSSKILDEKKTTTTTSLHCHSIFRSFL